MKSAVGTILVGVFVTFAESVAAGPPYITDDPEPTGTGHFENYLFVEGTRATGAFASPTAGFEVNYGPFADTQLTLSVPFTTNPGPGGLGLVWPPLGGGVKYRFIEEDDQGWKPQVAFFPSVSIPIGSASHNSPTTELLPIWLQKSFGTWTTFGGGGLVHNPGAGNRSFLSYGWAVTDQLSENLQLGFESFGQTRSSTTQGAVVAAGIGWVYDFNDVWHFIGSVNRGVVSPDSDRVSYNIALKWTK